jgi:hypothetical protein
VAKKQDLIGYCGLYCGDCAGYTQSIADLARDLREELRLHRVAQIADALAKIPFFKEFKDYEKCYNLLGTMTKMRCKQTCRGDSGPPNCKIRKCCRAKKIEGCWQCDEFPTCEKLKMLEPGHGVAHLKNLRKLKRQGPADFVKGKRHWYADK